MKYQCVLFDLDDTLWDCFKTLEIAHNEWMVLIQERFNVNTDHVQNIEDFRQYYSGLNNNSHDLTKLRKNAIKSAFPNISNDEVNDFFLIWEKARHVNIQYFPDSIETIHSLRNKYPNLIIGAVSDGNANVFEIPEIQTIFDFKISAEDAGYVKPHSQIFQMAIQKFHSLSQTEEGDILFVGDNYDKDILGAHAMGMDTFWIQINAKGSSTGVHTFESNNLNDLLKYI